jgi:cation:H+ antiporter
MGLLLFLLSFVIILVSCELFTNGVEWTGRRFELSEGAVGSVLAAVGTALPETMVPLIAILFLPAASSGGEEIGVGAIMGSPFTIGTLALFVCGLSLLLFRRRRRSEELVADGRLVRRDLGFFLLAYALAAAAAFLPADMQWPRYLLGISLLLLYAAYIWLTVRKGTATESEMGPLYYHRMFHMFRGRNIDREAAEPSTVLIIAQVLVAIAGIVAGAAIFVEQIQQIAVALSASPLILALLIAPMATELPEMYNSFMWVRCGKDVYAIGNLTGAMVFQSCIPVTVGLMLTPWHIDIGVPQQVLQAASMAIALFSAAVLYISASRKAIGLPSLLLGGALYAVFIALVLLMA